MKNFGIDEIQTRVTAENLTVGKLVKQAREKHYYTPEYVAEKIAISSVQLELIENDQSIPRLQTLHRLAELLKIDVTTLLSGEEQKNFLLKTDCILAK